MWDLHLADIRDKVWFVLGRRFWVKADGISNVSWLVINGPWGSPRDDNGLVIPCKVEVRQVGEGVLLIPLEIILRVEGEGVGAEILRGASKPRRTHVSSHRDQISAKVARAKYIFYATQITRVIYGVDIEDPPA